MKGEAPISPELNTTDFRQGMEQSLQKTEARHWWWLWLLVFVLLGVGGYWLLERSGQQSAPALEAAMKPIVQQVPVVAVTARQGDLPIYLTGLGSASRARTPALTTGMTTRTATSYSLPLDVSWEADVWGRIRRTVESNQANAQVSAADIETVRLSLQAAVAQAYF